jgi:hypothetical protein
MRIFPDPMYRLEPRSLEMTLFAMILPYQIIDKLCTDPKNIYLNVTFNKNSKKKGHGN